MYIYFLQLYCMIISKFYVKSNFKANVAGHLNRYLKLIGQCCPLKLSNDLSGIAHLNGIGATRFSLTDDYLRIYVVLKFKCGWCNRPLVSLTV